MTPAETAAVSAFAVIVLGAVGAFAVKVLTALGDRIVTALNDHTAATKVNTATVIENTQDRAVKTAQTDGALANLTTAVGAVHEIASAIAVATPPPTSPTV